MLHNRLDEFKNNLMIGKKTRFDLKNFKINLFLILRR
jgi:hypothetical protein